MQERGVQYLRLELAIVVLQNEFNGQQGMLAHAESCHLELADVGAAEVLDGLLYIVGRHVELTQHRARQLQARLQRLWHHRRRASLRQNTTQIKIL